VLAVLDRAAAGHPGSGGARAHRSRDGPAAAGTSAGWGQESSPMNDAVLETRGLHKAFGGIVATHDVSFGLMRGARHALIGPHGAGQTTFVDPLNAIRHAAE